MDLTSVLTMAISITFGSLACVVGGCYLAYKIKRNR